MWEELLRAVPVYLSSLFKFVLGPIGGYASGLHIFTTILTTIASMMTVVLLFAYFGDFMRKRLLGRFFRDKKKFTVRNRKFVTLWKKYGLIGVALLTPLLLTPIGGTILAVSFGAPKDKLILYMLASAVIWSVIFSSTIYFFGNEFLPDFVL